MRCGRRCRTTCCRRAEAEAAREPLQPNPERDTQPKTQAGRAPPPQVLLPTLRRVLGVDVEAEVQRRGFFPKGGGRVTLRAVPLPEGGSLPCFSLSAPGELLSVSGTAFAAGPQAAMAAAPREMADAAALSFAQALSAGGRAPLPAGAVAIAQVVEPPARAVGSGYGITLVATTAGGSLLGACVVGGKGVSPQAAGAAAGAALAKAVLSGAAVDENMADQLIAFMALARGRSHMLAAFPLSLHTRTAIAVAQQLTPAAITVAECGNGLCTVTVDGAGVARTSTTD